MSDAKGPTPHMPDPAVLQQTWKDIAERSQRVLQEFTEKQAKQPPGASPPDVLNLTGTFMEFTQRLLADPQKIVAAQMELMQEYMRLWQTTTDRMMGKKVEPVIDAPKDKRFADPAWRDEAIFDHIKQSYLLTSRWLTGLAKDGGGDEHQRKKLEFHMKQFVDAMAPTNFVATNPAVLRATVETGGENLVKGLKNVLEDIERGGGSLAIRQTDMDAFEVGRNVATSPGKVVFQNDMMQLIQYAPSTAEVHKQPLLIVPPWINKFYILDLKPENSFIKWAVDQGYTVFVISWVNPDERLRHKDFSDYMLEGPLAALDAIEKATGERKVSAIGYCIGGTLMAGALAYCAAKGDDRIANCTFFTAQVDFTDAGDLMVFIDEEQIANIEALIDKRGYMDGAEMATTFNMLRSNDLIWSFVVNNYLMGKDPLRFDLLYWNADSTRLPAAMHSYYLRNMYQKNLLVRPGALELEGVPIDLRTIKVPCYVQAGKEDHIAPVRSVYKMTQIFSGPMRFMLAGSGHIAGVVNPPSAKKYQHWLNDTAKNPPTLEEWQAGATEHPGSWWHDWDRWLSAQSGPKVPARDPAKGGLKPIEDAPGRT
ncbi:MAG: class I poly(R)-hydroxyalkanoic acid synthase [Rhodospirillales bacterium]|nr:MAG: class I poly(R)-hydroxyalkanoic acid synthase [Rhodospirillales bacterium]